MLGWGQATLDKTDRDTAQAQDRIKALQRELDEASAKNAEMKAENTGLSSSIRHMVSFSKIYVLACLPVACAGLHCNWLHESTTVHITC